MITNNSPALRTIDLSQNLIEDKGKNEHFVKNRILILQLKQKVVRYEKKKLKLSADLKYFP